MSNKALRHLVMILMVLVLATTGFWGYAEHGWRGEAERTLSDLRSKIDSAAEDPACGISAPFVSLTYKTDVIATRLVPRKYWGNMLVTSTPSDTLRFERVSPGTGAIPELLFELPCTRKG